MEKQFKKMILDYQEDNDILYYSYIEAVDNFDGYIKRLEGLRKGIDLPKDDVITTEYWLVDDLEKEIRGVLKIRHKSIPIYGNIGYDIPPKKRFLGYGTKILELGLEKARKLVVGDIRISCVSTNEGSKKIIYKNNGFFTGLEIANNEVYEQYLIK